VFSTEANGIEKAFAILANAFISSFSSGHTISVLARPFSKEISKSLDMNSGEADSAGAGLTAHRGGFRDGKTKRTTKGN
jgi:hypothetical protein